MPVHKKRNKNGTWSPIYGQAWSHAKTARAADVVTEAGHRPRYAAFLVLGWLHRLNIWCLANSTSGVVTALSDAKLSAVVWPEAFDDGLTPTRAGQLVRAALRAGGFLEDSAEGERVHEFRAFHSRILADRERHVGDDDDDTKTPPRREDSADRSAEGSAEGSAEDSAEGSADRSVEGSAAIGSDRIGSDRIGSDPIPPNPPSGGKPRRPPDRLVGDLKSRLGCGSRIAADQVRALRLAGWSDDRIRAAIADHAEPGLAPWDWTKRARGAGTSPAGKTTGVAAVAAWAASRREESA